MLPLLIIPAWIGAARTLTVFLTRLCILTKRDPRVGLGPLHPLPTCGEASARGSGLEAKAGGRLPSLNDSHVQPTGNAWP